MITKLNQLIELAQKKQAKKLSVACPYDIHTLQAVSMAYNTKIIVPILFGNKNIIEASAKMAKVDIQDFEIVDIFDDETALKEAVKMVSVGDADMLMKGLISSEKYLKAILQRQNGLLGQTVTITHIAVLENQNLNRLVFFGDAAMLPEPDLKQKITIIEALKELTQKFGIDYPKIAMISASEFVNSALPASYDAAVLCKMSQRKQLGKCIIEGPLSIELALDQESVEIKKLESEVAGKADCLIFPNIEAGNAFYKTNTKLAKANIAACLIGTKAPVVMTSRADSTLSKYYSICLCAACFE